MSLHGTLRSCIGRTGNERAVSFATSKIVRQAVREPLEKRPVARFRFDWSSGEGRAGGRTIRWIQGRLLSETMFHARRGGLTYKRTPVTSHGRHGARSP
jgi:hypothetical protein